MRKLSQTEIIQELLNSYQDITNTLNTHPDWIAEKPGSRCLIRPADHPYFTGSYRQLENVLRHMRDGGHETSTRDRKKLTAKYWAIRATYLNAEHRLVDQPVQRKTKNHKTVTVLERRSQLITPRPIPPRDLEAGLTWIQQEFQHRNLTAWLPPELHQHAAA